MNREVTFGKEIKDSDSLRLKALVEAALNMHRCTGEDFSQLLVELFIVVQIDRLDTHEIKDEMVAHVWDAAVSETLG